MTEKKETALALATQVELFEPTEITRPDVNIGKWAGWLFSSPWSKGLYETKTHKWTQKIGDEDMESSITIRPAKDRKRPTTTTWKVLLGLTEMWELSGKPVDGVVNFSARQLALMLGYKGFGTDTANRIQEQLEILTSSTISWEFAYKKKSGLDSIHKNMHLLESDSYRERKSALKSEKFQRYQQVILNRSYVENMLNGLTKPINYKVLISIKNDSCSNLYMLLDSYLSNKTRWERKAYALITEELELTGKRYENKNARLAKLKEFASELHGKMLSSGQLELRIQPTADKQDYKLVATKIPKTIKKRSHLKPVHSDEEAQFIAKEIISELKRIGGTHNIQEGVIESLAKWYSREMLHRALGIVRVDYKGKVKTSAVKTFVYVMHKIAHDSGKGWIKECKSSCPLRPENQKHKF